MNEAISPITPLEPTAPSYKDRSVGLTIFGVLTILLGCLAGLMVLLMLVGQTSAARANPASGSFTMILPAISIYVILAVALVWLGIGSIQARRWARALLLIFSWLWLIMGIFAIVMMAVIMPKIMANVQANMPANQPLPPDGALMVGMIIGLAFLSVIFILLPTIWIFFYKSQHVKATVETRDSVTRWTDACPLPVLALSVLLIFSVPMMLMMAVSGHCVMPFFGFFLSGMSGALFCIALAALWSYVAWLTYHLKQQGWWLALIALIVFMISGWVTFARHDVMEMYQLMGYPQAQIEQIQKSGMANGMRWIMPLSVLPFLIYLLFTKKYFPNKTEPQN